MSDEVNGNGKQSHIDTYAHQAGYRYNPNHDPKIETAILTNFGPPNFITSYSDSNVPDGVQRTYIQISPDKQQTIFNDTEMTSPRLFTVRCLLSKEPALYNEINLHFNKDDGDSFLLLQNKDSYYIPFGGLDIDAHPNKLGRLSTLSTQMTAQSPNDARTIATYAFNAMLSSIAFHANCSINIAAVHVLDVEHGNDHYTFSAWGIKRKRMPAGVSNSNIVAPMYSLYREAKSNPSPAYRYFCYAKIMEGAFGAAGKHIRKLARSAGVQLPNRKLTIPDDPYIHSELMQFVGKPVSHYYEKVVRKSGMRNFIAHFSLSDRGPMDFSNQTLLDLLINQAYVSELCVRVTMIAFEDDARIIAESYIRA